jgi:NTE family protein
MTSSIAPAQRPDTAPVDDARPRIGLALSGGGARGGAHIGVLLALRELGIPIDYIAGTSMGSVIGGLYASGLDEEEIESIAREVDWPDLFDEDPSRDDRSFRRKRDDDLFLVKQRAGFNDATLELPLGLVQGQDIDLFLGKILLSVSHVESFADLPIPFRAVAADVVTGEAVVLERGNLARAIRASLSIPGVLAPVEIDGRLLVDGGIAQNLPVDTVREMGADIVIAIDISTPLASREELVSVLSITGQLTGLLTNRGTAAQIEKLAPGDVLVTPNLGDISTAGFARIAETFAIGYDATMAVADELRALALAPAAYQAHRDRRPNLRAEELPQIDFVRLRNESRVADHIIQARLERIPTGGQFDIDATEAAIARVYGLGLFQNVRYDVVEEGGRTGLEIGVEERAWGPNYVQGGIEYSSAGDDESLLGVSLSYLRTAMNSLGAEWRSTIELGDEPFISTEWHQPLGWNAMSFAAAELSIERPLINVYSGSTRIAEIQARQSVVNVSLGHEIGNWGEVRFGLTRGGGDTELQIGDPTLPIIGDFDRGESFARFSVDTLDSMYFPTGGVAFVAEWRVSRENLGADTEFDQFVSRAVGAKAFGKNIFAGAVRYNTTSDGVAPPQNLFRLGGFWDLAGFGQNELTGQNVGRALAAYYRQIGNISRMPAYAGITIEKGNAWDSRDDISFANSLNAASLWVGAETPIGPVYLSYGRAEGGRDSIYFFIGGIY